MEPIGLITTPFADKFGIPRQPGLVPEAKGIIRLRKTAELRAAIADLEKFSHLWVLFVFHKTGAEKWKPTVRPPRLGGATRVGVLASRSPHRPNPIGMSVVKIERIDPSAKAGPEIHVSGVDILDGSPILDLKPYVPYADIVTEATSGWADEPIRKETVEWSTLALEKLYQQKERDRLHLHELINQLLALDPRPAAQKTKNPLSNPESWGQKYGFMVYDWDVKYQLTEKGFLITDLVKDA